MEPTQEGQFRLFGDHNLAEEDGQAIAVLLVRGVIDDRAVICQNATRHGDERLRRGHSVGFTSGHDSWPQVVEVMERIRSSARTQGRRYEPTEVLGRSRSVFIFIFVRVRHDPLGAADEVDSNLFGPLLVHQTGLVAERLQGAP